MGKYIHSLKKHPNEIVRSKSKSIFSKWKNACLSELKQTIIADVASSPPPQHSQSPLQTQTPPPPDSDKPSSQLSPESLADEVISDTSMDPKRINAIERLRRALAAQTSEQEDKLKQIATEMEKGIPFVFLELSFRYFHLFLLCLSFNNPFLLSSTKPSSTPS